VEELMLGFIMKYRFLPFGKGDEGMGPMILLPASVP